MPYVPFTPGFIPVEERKHSEKAKLFYILSFVVGILIFLIVFFHFL
jgi:hypothetical protein